MAVLLVASQPALEECANDLKAVESCQASSTSEAAAALLQALNAQVRLEWHVDLGNGCKASLSAELSRELTWPPDKVMVRTHSSSTTSASVFVTGKVSREQLAAVLDGGILAAKQIEQPPGAEDHEDSVEREACMIAAELEPVRLIDSDPSRLIVQPLSLQQWHHGACGHHALFSIRCILQGRLQELHDEHLFWHEVMVSIDSLASYGESSGRWPRSRISSAIIDELHAVHLVNSSSVLRGRVSVIPSFEVLEAQFSKPGSPERKALEDVRCGLRGAHGFLLGAATHWYAAVAVAGSRPRLVFMDSYNVALAQLRNSCDAEDLASKQLLKIRDSMYRDLRMSNLWQHRPQQHLDRAFVDGVEEWWKGAIKADSFWKHPPFDVRSQLKLQEFNAVRRYLEALSSVLQSDSGETERGTLPICAL